ncbi:DUF6651 domain-containing protein [Roseovarius sp. MMSF_3281]|uniref:DUF6651 domain-containing protein n=1 Tax=Roseovarius sp. MMSF_3281 TaxID=3046694 RepID=UPI00273D52AE|nr:DUF6651 domain-containing protein [Roseovarius sp. MMSF_3281]
MPMELKTIEHDGKTFAEVKDGKPVYIDDDGKELSFDAEFTHNKIKELNFEAQKHREAKDAAEGALKKFEGIEDPEAAIKAIETVKNIDESKLIEAGKVEEIKAAAVKAAEEQREAAIKAKDEEYAPIMEERDKLKQRLDNELIGGGFARSKFVAEKVAIPHDMLQSRFGQNFKVEDGELIAYDNQGNKIYSREKPGEIASFDEALETLVDQYPYRDNILKGRGHNGGGANGDDGRGGDKTITRAEFEALDHGQRSQKMSDGFTLVD